MKLTEFTEHNDLNMLFISFESRRFSEDISSPGRMPQMKTLIELFRSLKQLAISRRSFAISSGKSWYRLLVLDDITTFLKDEKSVNHVLAIIHVTLCCPLSHS